MPYVWRDISKLHKELCSSTHLITFELKRFNKPAYWIDVYKKLLDKNVPGRKEVFYVVKQWSFIRKIPSSETVEVVEGDSISKELNSSTACLTLVENILNQKTNDEWTIEKADIKDPNTKFATKLYNLQWNFVNKTKNSVKMSGMKQTNLNDSFKKLQKKRKLKAEW
jgi:hypothetical protein